MALLFLFATLLLSAIYHISFKPQIFTDIIFFKRADPFHWVCLFCISVRNKIYVLEVEMLELVLLARYLQF